MEKDNKENSEKKLDELIQLTKHSIAIQLFINGATMGEISKNLHISTVTLVPMLKGIKKEK